MRGIPFVACAIVAVACSSSTTTQAPDNSGGSGGTGGSSTGGSSGSGGSGGAGGTSASGGLGGSAGQGGSAGATGGSGGAAGAGGSDASLGGAAGNDASLGGSGGTGGSDASVGGGGTGGTSGSGGSGGTGGSATGGTSGSGGAGGTSGSDAGDAATGGSAGDASTDASSDASDGAAGSDAGADAQSDASSDAGDAATDAPVGDAGACPGGVTGGDGTVHYPRWKIVGDARPDSEFTATPNVVLDHTTCLMWHRAANAATDWTTANTACNSSTVDGYTDWRLPTRAELISLIDFTRINPALNPTVFPGVSNATANGARFWSSTVDAIDSNKRWSVLHGSYGQMTYFAITDPHAYRCVRGTGAPSGPRFDTSTSGVVKDNETALIWEAAPVSSVYTLAAAVSYCSSLGLTGASWRLPTIRELATLPDPTLGAPALPAAFTSVSTWYWSSTPTYNANPAQNWAVHIGLGFSAPDGASNPYANVRVRCVH